MGYRGGSTVNTPITHPSPVKVSHLSHHFGAKIALNEVSFELQAGQFSALLGPNGAGKTTLFSILTRLLQPSEGQAMLFGEDLARHSGRALSKTGVVFQQSTLDLDLTVLQNLHYHGAIQGMSSRHIRARAEAELSRFELWERRDERVRNLNGGHRRRVEIARALLHQPALLLLDEASAGLDLESRTSLYQHVRKLCDSDNIAVLWTTHLVEELALDDDALLLANGQLRDRGSLRKLTESWQVQHPADLILALTALRS